MNKIKKTILSVLLFSFTFLVVHDYVMADIDKSSYQVKSTVQESQTATKPVDEICVVSHLHESIHTMITMDSVETVDTALILDTEPSYIESSFASNNNFVLERPPLS